MAKLKLNKMLQYHFKLFILKKCTGGVYTTTGSSTVVEQSNSKPKIKGSH